MMDKKILITIIFSTIFVFVLFLGIYLTQPKVENIPIVNVEPDGIKFLGKPKIWYCDRVLIPLNQNSKIDIKVWREFLNPNANLSKLGETIDPIPIEYSCRSDVGRCYHLGKVCFEHAVQGENYIIEWGMKYCDTGQRINANCSKPNTCVLYFTGIGCPHCALTDPYLFYEVVPKYSLVLVEYELYHEPENAEVFDMYLKNSIPKELRGFYAGVPHLFIDKDTIIVGDQPILDKIEKILEKKKVCELRIT